MESEEETCPNTSSYEVLWEACIISHQDCHPHVSWQTPVCSSKKVICGGYSLSCTSCSSVSPGASNTLMEKRGRVSTTSKSLESIKQKISHGPLTPPTWRRRKLSRGLLFLRKLKQAELPPQLVENFNRSWEGSSSLATSVRTQPPRSQSVCLLHCRGGDIEPSRPDLTDWRAASSPEQEHPSAPPLKENITTTPNCCWRTHYCRQHKSHL